MRDRYFRPPSEFADDFGDYRSPLKFYDGRTVTNAAEWQARREEILSRWHEVMGAWPALIENPQVEYLDKTHRETLTQHRVRFEVAPEGRAVDG